MSLHRCVIAALLGAVSVLGSPRTAGQNRDLAPARLSARESAPIDLAGYWVSVVTEDWRYRMVTPQKGDYARVPITDQARLIAEAWDPAADETAGLACKSYGGAAIMRVPGRIHVTWQDDDTLRVDTDAGMQTRLFRFTTAPSISGPRTWQGDSTARWEGSGEAAGQPPGGSLMVVTTNLRAGYLRKNGVPYSEDTVVTEYYDAAPLPDGGRMLLVTTVVEDPRYLRQSFIVSSHFKKEADASKWDPQPCSAR